MATSITLNGTSYSIPATGEGNWSTNVSNYLIAISTGVLTKAGGSFTLTADVDFGANYGIKSLYYKSRNTPSTTGLFRAGNDESISWRNAANSADKALKVNASDVLEFDGNPLITLALGAANTVLRMNSGGTAYEFSTLVDANIDASAAIDASKIANGSVSSTEFQYIGGLTSDAQTQITSVTGDLATHEADTANPHTVTATQVGLGSVDNTSDADKPVSTATQTALDLKVALAGTETITGAKTFDEALTVKEIATPSTPASGYKSIYPKTDGLLYTLNDAGEEVAVGSGSGAGEINYVTNPTPETNTSDWTVTSATLTRTTTSGEILRGTASFRLEAAADGNTIETTITVPEADENKLLKVTFDSKSLGAYATGDWVVSVEDVGSTVLMSEDVPAGQGLAQFTFVSNTAGDYTLKFTSAAGAAISSTDALCIDNVIVGPGRTVSGAAVDSYQLIGTEIDSYLGSTTGLTTDPLSRLILHRSGDTLSIDFDWRISAGTVGSDSTDLTLDVASLLSAAFGIGNPWNSATQANVVAGGAAYESSTGAAPLFVGRSGDNLVFYTDTQAGAIDGNECGTATGNVQQISFNTTTIPVEWAGSGTLNVINDSVVYANARLKADGLSSGTSLLNATYTPIATWNNTDSNSDFDGTTYTVPADGEYYLDCTARINSGTTVTGVAILRAKVNGTVVKQFSAYLNGIYPSWQLTTTITCTKGQTITVEAYQASGSTETLHTADNGTFLAINRLADYSAGQPVGFGLATADSAGLVSREYDSGEQTLPSLTWSGTAPTTEDFATYRWTRIGNQVTLNWHIRYDSAGSSVTAVFWELPLDSMPRPFQMSGATTGEYLHFAGTGVFQVNGNSAGNAGNTRFYRASADSYRVYTFATSTALKQVVGSITYTTDD